MSDRFTWYELMTTDAAAAEAFYCSVVGWHAQPVGDGYTVFQAGESGVAGLIRPEKIGAGPSWIGYISVGDVDACAAQVTAAGGQVHVPPTDIPGMLRFAMVADPQGAVFMLFKPISDAPPPPDLPDKPGFIAWRELLAAEGGAAFGFYEQLFGWTKVEAMDMGPAGVYQTFAAGGEAIGGVMTKPPEVPRPHWLFYIRVDGIEPAIARLKAAGGTLLMGPQQVPGGGWIAQGLDPQGAMFCLTGPLQA
jgi:uncharacterized protein